MIKLKLRKVATRQEGGMTFIPNVTTRRISFKPNFLPVLPMFKSHSHKAQQDLANGSLGDLSH